MSTRGLDTHPRVCASVDAHIFPEKGRRLWDCDLHDRDLAKLDDCSLLNVCFSPSNTPPSSETKPEIKLRVSDMLG